MNLKTRLEQVKIVRKIIKLNCLNNEQLSEFCDWLGFNDISFRELSPEEKLQDYLLKASFWRRRKQLGLE